MILSFSFLHIWLQITKLETWKLLEFCHFKPIEFLVIQLMVWKHRRKISEIKYLLKNCLCQEGGTKEQRKKERRNPLSLRYKMRQGSNMTQQHKSNMESSQIWRLLVTGQGNSPQSFLLLISYQTHYSLLATEHLIDESMMHLKSWCLISSNSM